jgi:hypothetical protein
MGLQVDVIGQNAADALIPQGRGLGQAALPVACRQIALADPHQGEEFRSPNRSQMADCTAKHHYGRTIGGQDVKTPCSHSIVLALGRVGFAHDLIGKAMKQRITRIARFFRKLSDMMSLLRRKLLQHDASFRNEVRMWALNANSPLMWINGGSI